MEPDHILDHRIEQAKIKASENIIGKLYKPPFADVIKHLQAQRRLHAKDTLLNLLYKQLANGLYGLIVRGISDKRKYDIKSGRYVRMEAGELSNPILASWITGFIRSIIGECLHVGDKLKGRVVSVTTDGFITDIPEMEKEIIKYHEQNPNIYSLVNQFKHLRKWVDVNGVDTALELKHKGISITSFNTRGQISADANISALTGFQAKNYLVSEAQDLILDALSKNNKTMEYVLTSLTSALDLYKDGIHVTKVFKAIGGNKPCHYNFST